MGSENTLTIIIVNSSYGFSILKDKKQTWMLSGLLSSLYGFLYVVLNLADFALLLGSVGLLVILSLVMYVTRNFDWYRKEGGVEGG